MQNIQANVEFYDRTKKNNLVQDLQLLSKFF